MQNFLQDILLAIIDFSEQELEKRIRKLVIEIRFVASSFMKKWGKSRIERRKVRRCKVPLSNWPANKSKNIHVKLLMLEI